METARTWGEQDLRRLEETIAEGERRFEERRPGRTPGWRFAA